MANSADPDQLASLEANWSGSTLFAKAGYIQVQQDKGYNIAQFWKFLFVLRFNISVNNLSVMSRLYLDVTVGTDTLI